jgi:serine/threonine protein kinase
MDLPMSHHGRDGAKDIPLSAGDGAAPAIDRFVILREIGEGGMGQVFLAQHPVTGMEVAVKRLKPSLVTDAGAVRRFLAEARHMYHLNHPRILRIMEILDPPAGPYYVMPHIPSGPLSHALREGQPTDYVLSLRVAGDIASALAYAHQKGILHRDLKPANVLMDADGHASLSDFGLVRDFTTNDSIVDGSPSFCEGTAPYMSPAVARGEAEDTRCDIYSFGAMLYEMLTGRRPYHCKSGSMRATLQMIAAGPPAKILKENPSAPAGLAAVAEGCMARELHDRYAKMNDVVADLELVSAGKLPLGPHRTWRRNSRGRIGLALLVCLSIALAVAWRVEPGFFGPQVVRLTNLIQPPADGSGGISANSDGTILLQSDRDNPRVSLVFPYTPKGQYDLCIDFTRSTGDDGLDQCLSYRGHGFCWTLGGGHNSTSSFWRVGSGEFGNNPTASPPSPSVLTNGKRHHSKVEVRSGRVAAYLDGVKMSEYMTDYADMHFPNPNELPNIWRNRLGVSILNSDVTLHKIEVIEQPIWRK